MAGDEGRRRREREALADDADLIAFKRWRGARSRAAGFSTAAFLELETRARAWAIHRERARKLAASSSTDPTIDPWSRRPVLLQRARATADRSWRAFRRWACSLERAGVPLEVPQGHGASSLGQAFEALRGERKAATEAQARRAAARARAAAESRAPDRRWTALDAIPSSAETVAQCRDTIRRVTTRAETGTCESCERPITRRRALVVAVRETQPPRSRLAGSAARLVGLAFLACGQTCARDLGEVLARRYGALELFAGRLSREDVRSAFEHAFMSGGPGVSSAALVAEPLCACCGNLGGVCRRCGRSHHPSLPDGYCEACARPGAGLQMHGVTTAMFEAAELAGTLAPEERARYIDATLEASESATGVGRRCAECDGRLPFGWTAVYCSRECARSDA